MRNYVVAVNSNRCCIKKTIVLNGKVNYLVCLKIYPVVKYGQETQLILCVERVSSTLRGKI